MEKVLYEPLGRLGVEKGVEGCSFRCSCSMFMFLFGVGFWGCSFGVLITNILKRTRTHFAHQGRKSVPARRASALIPLVGKTFSLVQILQSISLPEFMNFTLFGNIILVANIKFGLVLGHPLSK